MGEKTELICTTAPQSDSACTVRLMKRGKADHDQRKERVRIILGILFEFHCFATSFLP